MDGKEIIALTDEHLQRLRDAGYSEVDNIPIRGVIVDGKFKRSRWSEATHEVRVFKLSVIPSSYVGGFTFVNKTELEEIVYVVAKL